MDNKKPVMTMLCGLPASGKSTYARKLAKETNAVIFSSDELRKEMFGNVNDQRHNSELFIELHRRIKDCLRSGKSVIYDACNINSKRRRAFLQELSNIDCTKNCIIMATNYSCCMQNNKYRNRQVPAHVVIDMYKHWNTPYWFEGWDDISVRYFPGIKKYNIWGFLIAYKNYNQDNPHHTLSLGEHCLRAADYIMNQRYNHKKFLSYVAATHDCGKPFVRRFQNSKGEPTDIAHYYNHENVGAYDSLFFDYPDGINPIDVSVLVNLHMQPYNWEHQDKKTEQKLRDKYRKLWGEELYQYVIMLHEADKAAH